MSKNNLSKNPLNSPRRKYSRYWWIIFRVLISIGLLWKATSGIDWLSFFSTNLNIKPMWLILAMVSIFIGNFCGGIRWGLLLKKAGFHEHLLNYVGLVFTSNLINQGLPSTIGGDAYRALKASLRNRSSEKLNQNEYTNLNLKHLSNKLRLSIGITIIDRLLGLAGNNIVGAIGLILGGSIVIQLGAELGYVILGVTLILSTVGSLVLTVKMTSNYVGKILIKFHMNRVEPCLNFAFRYPITMLQLMFSSSIHCCNIFAFFCCLKACGVVNVAIESLMIGIPLLSLLLILPISISGWGLREATLSSLLNYWHIEPSITVIASMAYGAITFVCALPGLINLLNINFRKKISKYFE